LGKPEARLENHLIKDREWVGGTRWKGQRRGRNLITKKIEGMGKTGNGKRSGSLTVIGREKMTPKRALKKRHGDVSGSRERLLPHEKKKKKEED